ncbi:MAG: 2-hydroxychromene-2-carboxylate isomerase, partial [Burkholderiaceae bacterium]
MKTIDYYLFPQSPYAYMGHDRVVAMAAKAGAQIRIKPMDAAKVFPVSGGLPLPKRAPQRVAYRMIELKRWRDYLGLPMHVEPAFFPVAGDPAGRMICIAASMDAGKAVTLAGEILKCVWERQENIADDTVLARCATAAGFDGAALLATSKEPAAQAAYDKSTQEAIDAQVFGAPSYVFN